MTMQIDIKNTSTNYIGKVTEIDVSDDGTEIKGTEHILNPGEDVQVYAWDTRILKVEEIEQIR